MGGRVIVERTDVDGGRERERMEWNGGDGEEKGNDEVASMVSFRGNGVEDALQRKSHLCVPFPGIARPQSQFPHSCVCERFIYSQDQSTHFSCRRIGRSIVGIINRSKTHKCENRDCGRAIPFLGIFVSNFRYWFFAVWKEGRDK